MQTKHVLTHAEIKNNQNIETSASSHTKYIQTDIDMETAINQYITYVHTYTKFRGVRVL